MAVKVTKGQISDGTISKNTCIEEYYLCGKFSGFMKSAQFWVVPLYYYYYLLLISRTLQGYNADVQLHVYNFN